MKKQITIELVGGVGVAFLAFIVYCVGESLQWPGFYKYGDCHCCDHFWWDILFPPLFALSVPWIFVCPLLIARRHVARCVWKRIFGSLASGLTFFTFPVQVAWVLHWGCVIGNCVKGLLAGEDMLMCGEIVLYVALMLSIFLSGMFVSVKRFFKSDGFIEKESIKGSEK